jgi:DNA polymerase bacteriophage-type
MVSTSNLIGLDFETYGAMNLPKYGLHRYVNNSTFRPLLGAVAWEGGGQLHSECLDFALGYERYEADRELLKDLIDGQLIVAHNAPFEQAVLRWMGIPLPSERFIDSAVLARAAGAAGKLEVAAPQLLGTDKMEVGVELIKLFSIPGKYQEQSGNMHFDPRIRLEFSASWRRFAEYCEVDAQLSLRLAMLLLGDTTDAELANTAVTMSMNNVGWHVDLKLVEEMQCRYEANLAAVEAEFRTATGAFELNLNSSKQLQAWCAKRGVRTSSFDESHVEKLIARLDARLANPAVKPGQADNYTEVLHLLRTKQALGGSSLKKLQVILDTTSEDGRLRDQYLHIGAGATYRTTGRGVQMQNLKRLHGGGSNMEELLDPDSEWDNGELAANVRQVFTASDPAGRLVVGDFSSVESRGLAWQAGEEWKLQSYRWGQDLYKVQAGLIFGKPAIDVTKDERQIGKVGELSCGYGAGPDAVKSFAEKMGVELSEGESLKLVRDWRAANQEIVKYWYALDDALHTALNGRATSVQLAHGWVEITPVLAPQSLRDQVKDEGLLTLVIKVIDDRLHTVLTRVIHGVILVGRNIRYWKPTERKTGDLWTDHFTNPKTKQLQKFTVYGGKLAGLITQSLCREVFFGSLRQMHEWVQTAPNVQLVGQFHDEIVLDWVPGPVSLSGTKAALEAAMTSTTLTGFPLAAEIKDDYRYTK